MPPRDPSLPEGTDHIIDTNIDLGDTGGGSGGGGSASGRSGGTGGGSTTGGSSGSGGGSAFQFDKDGGGGNRASGIAGAVKDQLSTLTSQAGERARGLADDGKTQATTFLQTIAQVVADAAGSVEDRLGSQYAGFGQRASSSINSLASSLDERSVDDLIDDARSFVQRSPAVAIGVAALVGFAVARVVRSSVAELSGGQSDDSDRGPGSTGGMAASGGTGGGTSSRGTSSGGTGSGGTGSGGAGMSRGGASGGLDATSGGFGEQGLGTAGGMGGSGASTGPGSSGGTGNAPTV